MVVAERIKEYSENFIGLLSGIILNIVIFLLFIYLFRYDITYVRVWIVMEVEKFFKWKLKSCKCVSSDFSMELLYLVIFIIWIIHLGYL